MTDALETLALDAELLELEHQLAVLEPQLLQAREDARAEVDDLQRVESGPTSWWLALTGQKAERVAKERAEAEDAVETLKVLGATGRALGTRLAEVRERRHGRPDPAPALTALAAGDPELLALLDRHQRLARAATDAREARDLLDRADAQLGKVTERAFTRRGRHDREDDQVRLEVCDTNLRHAERLIDDIDRSLEAVGLPGVRRVELPSLAPTGIVPTTIFHVAEGKSSGRDQREALVSFSAALPAPRAAIARELLEGLRRRVP